MAAITFEEAKEALRGILGVHEDSTGSLRDKVGQMFQRTIPYAIHPRQAANKPYFAQTGSLSLTQPLLEQPMFTVEDDAVVHAIDYILPAVASNGVATISVSVSTSDAWTIEVNAYGPTTFSVATLIATLKSTTDGITNNKPRGVNACTLISANKRLSAGQVVTVKVTKQLLGAQFRGGTVQTVLREGTS